MFCAPEVVRIPEVAQDGPRTCGCRMKFAYRVSGGLGGGTGRASEGSADAGETEVLGISAACGSTGGPARRKLLLLFFSQSH